MNTGSRIFESGSLRGRRPRLLALALLGAVIASGCTVAAETPSSSAPAVASSVVASPSPSAEPSLAATPTPQPSVGPAPSGAWAGLDWLSVPTSLSLPAAELADLRVSGWSGGFIAFSSFGSVSPDVGGGKVDETIGVSSSPDGVHWTAGKPLDITGLQYWIDVVKMVEGPAGLLAIGMPRQGACGGPTSVTSLWTSTDGNSWTSVDFAAQFGTATVWTVDAGSTGYVATGDLSDGTRQVVWVSGDGRSWRQVPLPKATFGTVEVQGGTAFAGGYVLSGAVRGDEGCGGPNYVTPSLWWSADGKAWSRVKLSGATPGTDAWMSVTRISDHSLLAVQTSYDSTTQVISTAGWVSTDGRAWSPTSASAADLPGSLYSNGRRCMTLSAPPEASAKPVVATVGSDLIVTELSQSGDVPTVLGNIGWTAALGPSGLLVVSLDGNNVWLGMPTSR